jgi:hypothetical protein
LRSLVASDSFEGQDQRPVAGRALDSCEHARRTDHQGEYSKKLDALETRLKPIV